MIGAIEGMTFQEGKLHLDQGDMLVMYTDGVTEAMDRDNMEFGDDRLVETLKDVSMHNCHQAVETILSDVAAFVADAEQSDDITLLTIKRI
jgi:sigma-B regulation protein RsbU (phosphoserine phosphatase)